MSSSPSGVEAPPSTRLRADLVLVLITALWGATFVVVKDALAQADPFTFVALRFAVGGAVATALAGRALLHPGIVRYGLFLGGFLFLGFVLQTAGLLHTTESRSAFITGLSVILVPLVSVAVLRRRPHPPSLVGVGIALVGLYVLTGGLTAGAGRQDVLLGDLLTLGCAICFALHISFTEKFAPRVPALALVAVQLWTVSALAALCIPFTATRLDWHGGFIPALLFCGVFASALAIALQTWAQARTSAVRAALIFSLEPVFAASASVALGRERLGPRELLGGSLTVLAILVAEVGNAWWSRRFSAGARSA